MGLMTALAVPVSAKADEEPPVRLVTGDRYPPFAGRTLPEGGLATLLVRRVFDKMDREVKITFKPWNRGLKGTLQNRYDGAFPFIRSKDRERKFLFSDPVVEAVQRPLVRSGTGFKAQTLKDLESHSFCLPVSYAPPPAIDALVRRRAMGHISANTMTDCLRLLDRGRVAFIPLSEREGRAMLRRNANASTARVQFLDMVIASVPHHVLFARDNPRTMKLKSRFDSILRAMHFDGSLARLKKRYMARLQKADEERRESRGR